MQVDGVFRQNDMDGNPVYAAVSRGAFGWTTAIIVPLSVLDAPVRGSTMALIVGGAMLMVCGLVAVRVLSRRLSHDLSLANRAAEAVADGRALPPAPAHVAETRQLYESLQATASLLERRLHERDREVQRAEAARAEAEEASRTKDHFLAVLGHELRNPLAPSLTTLEVMKMRAPHVFQRERQILERQIGHMVRLVNDLLDASRLARGKVELQRLRFELRQAVDRAVDMARPLIDRHRHELLVDVPAAGLVLDADEDRIVQVLANLLTNAAKYTPPGGHIWLTARATGAMVTIACEDDGPGVDPALLPTLFDAFVQGPRTLERHQGGLGLGLALARSLTEMHGGTIKLEGRAAGQGSRFVVRLPLAAGAPPPGPADAPAGPAARAARKVLVVDDNLDAGEMLRGALEQAGHSVAIAADGPAALAAAAASAPEVAVLDIGLPGMSGYELARQLRQRYPRIRLIALTGYGQPADAEAAARAGFDLHCAKPIAISALLAHIDA
jgi:signal transduction histidine kinase